jgi:hypothetical protein
MHHTAKRLEWAPCLQREVYSGEDSGQINVARLPAVSTRLGQFDM